MLDGWRWAPGTKRIGVQFLGHLIQMRLIRGWPNPRSRNRNPVGTASRNRFPNGTREATSCPGCPPPEVCTNNNGADPHTQTRHETVDLWGRWWWKADPLEKTNGLSITHAPDRSESTSFVPKAETLAGGRETRHKPWKTNTFERCEISLPPRPKLQEEPGEHYAKGQRCMFILQLYWKVLV